MIGVDVAPSEIDNPELRARTDTPPRPPISDTVMVMAEHPIEKWFTSTLWDDLFPNANGKAFGLTQEQLLEECYLETADMPSNLNDV